MPNLTHPVICCAMRVQNESRWIGRVIDSVRGLCNGGVYVFDDHSTDDTMVVAQSHGAQIIRSTFTGLNETRDKNELMRVVTREVNPDWVVNIDGDEVLESVGVAQIRDSIASGIATSYTLQVLYLWDHENQIRVDGLYENANRPSLFSTRHSDLQFRPVRASITVCGPANFHCSNVPYALYHSVARCPARLKHYGYLTREMRLAKYAMYNREDPGNLIEDGYRHIVQGDIPEAPAWARLRWAGPLMKVKYVEPELELQTETEMEGALLCQHQ